MPSWRITRWSSFRWPDGHFGWPVGRCSPVAAVPTMGRVWSALRSLWEEPAVADPPRRNRWDWVVVACSLLLGTEVLEAGRSLPALRVSVAAATAVLLLWRRRSPLVVLFVLAVFFAVANAALVDAEQDQLASGLMLGVAAYSVVRWASGRHITVAVAVMVASVTAHALTSPGDAVDHAATSALFYGAVTLGAWLVRGQANLHAERVHTARLEERHRIARELHDSVAHHVSGIVIQARAARAVAEVDPEGAAAAMGTVESVATDALSEMRDLVSVLRTAADPETAPQRSLADLTSLAGALASDRNPRVVVELTGDLDRLGPTVEASLFRLAQEAVTNAIRHARHASKIAIRVTGSDRDVELTVTDDGAPALAPAAPATGYGLIGMAERAAQLDGSFEAGPTPGGGWLVRAQIPKLGPQPS